VGIRIKRNLLIILVELAGIEPAAFALRNQTTPIHNGLMLGWVSRLALKIKALKTFC
jgi:hypothetical protein